MPGSTTASTRVTGIRRSETTSVVGCPITSAGDIPIYNSLSAPNFFAISSLVASEIGLRPSINRLVIRGISSITAPIFIPSPRVAGMLFIISSVSLQARQPIIIPMITPRKSGSPKSPNFFFIPSESICTLLMPGT